MQNSLISIIVPCYNQAQYLDKALQSVLDQTYSNWECIIVNDGSSDDTDILGKKWVGKDSRFKYIYQENGGLSSARNTGLDVSRGGFIQFLDADDFLNDQKLEKSIFAFQTHDATLVLTDFKMFDLDVSKTSPPFCVLKSDYFNYNNMLLNWDHLFSIPIHCGLFQSVFFQDFRFPLDLAAKEDWIMWLSLFKSNPKTIFIQEALVLYRLHEMSMTQNQDLMNENLVNALAYLKEVLSNEDYKALLGHKINRLQAKTIALEKEVAFQKNNFRTIKDSNTYKLGYTLRYLLQKTKTLGIAIKMLKLKQK
ncbi:glycosyltransferase family 2 protein [Flavobacterium sp. SOK18b]|uniref:glycosyltransferase family 2 protein n=1 Tax=Flavobacterium sp. SOK18b TaxID=797900 RepID=UPI0015F8AF9E|nr:glycosyltransferase family 2 protein [Flavobacterium sp. SOK18b]MBB1192499.1 glycosyltransferase family 2 protein [Flavobacterium sp. SOK18b]